MGIDFLLGGLVRLFPSLMQLWSESKQRDHEAAMFDLQLKADAQRGQLELQKLETAGRQTLDKAEIEAIVAASTAQARSLTKTGYWFLDTLLVLSEVASAFVRPVITYWFCVIMYGAYKLASYTMIVSGGVGWAEAVMNLWTKTDYDVMLSIIGFWFMDRAIRKGAPKG